MIITAIKQQVKRQDRYSIYVDEKYAFSFSQHELIKSDIKIGSKVTEEELSQLQNSAVIDKAYDRALNLISHRPRSVGEIRDYLKRKDIIGNEADMVIDKLLQRGYLDDYDFATRWVATRRLLKSTSKLRLAQELRQKRVSDDVISDVLAEDVTDERKVLTDLIERKRKQSKYQDNLKLMQYLARQGFRYDEIKSALAEE